MESGREISFPIAGPSILSASFGWCPWITTLLPALHENGLAMVSGDSARLLHNADHIVFPDV